MVEKGLLSVLFGAPAQGRSEYKARFLLLILIDIRRENLLSAPLHMVTPAGFEPAFSG